MTVVELGLYALLLAVAAAAIWRRPVVALSLFLISLAVHNAVMDAVRHLGVTGLQTPLTPLRVWSAIHANHGRGG